MRILIIVFMVLILLLGVSGCTSDTATFFESEVTVSVARPDHRHAKVYLAVSILDNNHSWDLKVCGRVSCKTFKNVIPGSRKVDVTNALRPTDRQITIDVVKWFGNPSLSLTESATLWVR